MKELETRDGRAEAARCDNGGKRRGGLFHFRWGGQWMIKLGKTVRQMIG